MEKYVFSAQTWNIILLFVQLVIMAIQIIVTWQISKQGQYGERGFFMLSTEDRGTASWQKWNYFDLNSDGKIRIRLMLSNSPTILRESKIYINSTIRKQSVAPVDSVFSLDGKNNELNIMMELKDFDLDSGKLQCTIILKLETLSRVEYVEKITVEMIKDDSSEYWYLRKYIPQLFSGTKDY